ncbi:hypothetical protein [Mesorhizobium sp. M4B.F.Ca.ET.143.01.1.1]|uniref:hypothetical protein n=1 Tax=Mesorhizobium sp. M4B.F.Ca.ET.143.01.1.1 TaxID=2563947 RepID=UPI001FEFB345|nr:hypothetical protein [Mesorhizobium sp. M4B.F.Ca.ET.143.01.1.1]
MGDPVEHFGIASLFEPGLWIKFQETGAQRIVHRLGRPSQRQARQNQEAELFHGRDKQHILSEKSTRQGLGAASNGGRDLRPLPRYLGLFACM